MNLAIGTSLPGIVSKEERMLFKQEWNERKGNWSKQMSDKEQGFFLVCFAFVCILTEILNLKFPTISFTYYSQ